MINVVSYYTLNTPYDLEATKLKTSLDLFNIPHVICGVQSRGSWDANTKIKPEIILNALDIFGEGVMYVDADATFHASPEIDLSGCDWAAHVMDKGFWGQDTTKRTHSLMSGTVYFADNDAARQVLRQWAANNKAHPKEWDQRNLETIWQKGAFKFKELPFEYCAIDKTMQVTDAVIRHHQASRRLRRLI